MGFSECSHLDTLPQTDRICHAVGFTLADLGGLDSFLLELTIVCRGVCAVAGLERDWMSNDPVICNYIDPLPILHVFHVCIHSMKQQWLFIHYLTPLPLLISHCILCHLHRTLLKKFVRLGCITEGVLRGKYQLIIMIHQVFRWLITAFITTTDEGSSELLKSLWIKTFGWYMTSAKKTLCHLVGLCNH